MAKTVRITASNLLPFVELFRRKIELQIDCKRTGSQHCRKDNRKEENNQTCRHTTHSFPDVKYILHHIHIFVNYIFHIAAK